MGEKREEEKKEEGRDSDKKGGGFSGRVRMGESSGFSGCGVSIILIASWLKLSLFFWR